MCVFTWTAELFAFDLADALVGKATGTGASSTAGLNRVVLKVVSKPLQMAIAHERVLGQMTDNRNYIFSDNNINKRYVA